MCILTQLQREISIIFIFQTFTIEKCFNVSSDILSDDVEVGVSDPLKLSRVKDPDTQKTADKEYPPLQFVCLKKAARDRLYVVVFSYL